MKNQFKKRILAAALIFAMLLAMFPPAATYAASGYIASDYIASGHTASAASYSVAANNPIRVTVNGRWVHFPDQLPVIVENRVLVPVGGVFVEMGFVPNWDANTRIATLTRSDFTIVIPAGANSFVVNNVVITPDVPQRMINNRLMLPLRAIADAVGGTAIWDSVNRVAHITTPNAPSPSPSPSPSPAASPTPTPAPTATPSPFLTAAPRFEGNPAAFGSGVNAYMLGLRYTNAIIGINGHNGWSRHNLNRQWGTLNATIGRHDSSGNQARTIRFIGDGRDLGTFTVQGDTFQPFNISIDVRGVAILTVEITNPGDHGVTVVMGNAVLHPADAVTATPTPSPTPTPTPQPFLTAAPRTAEFPTGFATGGNAYMQGIRHSNAIWGVSGVNGWSEHNLGGRFTTLTATIGRFDDSGNQQRTIRFIEVRENEANREIASFRVEGSIFHPLNISVDVRGVHNLRIEIENPYPNGVSIVLANILIQ